MKPLPLLPSVVDMRHQQRGMDLIKLVLSDQCKFGSVQNLKKYVYQHL